MKDNETVKKVTSGGILNPPLVMCGIVCAPGVIAGGLRGEFPCWLVLAIWITILNGIGAYWYAVRWHIDKLQPPEVQIRQLELTQEKGEPTPRRASDFLPKP